MEPLDRVFANLDRWRHLPAYQLERRADIFFSVYLKGLVEEVTGAALEDELLPELPIKRDLIWPELPSHASVKVDYVLFSRNRRRVFFVELKTDAQSRRDTQDGYLEAAQQLGFRKIVQGICEIVTRTQERQKYYHLVFALTRLGYLTVPPDLREVLYQAPGAGLGKRLRAIRVTDEDPVVEVLYVQPEATAGVRGIDFAQFAAYVARHDDPLSQVFASHLVKWRSAAGSCEPI